MLEALAQSRTAGNVQAGVMGLVGPQMRLVRLCTRLAQDTATLNYKHFDADFFAEDLEAQTEALNAAVARLCDSVGGSQSRDPGSGEGLFLSLDAVAELSRAIVALTTSATVIVLDEELLNTFITRPAGRSTAAHPLKRPPSSPSLGGGGKATPSPPPSPVSPRESARPPTSATMTTTAPPPPLVRGEAPPVGFANIPRSVSVSGAYTYAHRVASTVGELHRVLTLKTEEVLRGETEGGRGGAPCGSIYATSLRMLAFQLRALSRTGGDPRAVGPAVDAFVDTLESWVETTFSLYHTPEISIGLEQRWLRLERLRSAAAMGRRLLASAGEYALQPTSMAAQAEHAGRLIDLAELVQTATDDALGWCVALDLFGDPFVRYVLPDEFEVEHQGEAYDFPTYDSDDDAAAHPLHPESAAQRELVRAHRLDDTALTASLAGVVGRAAAGSADAGGSGSDSGQSSDDDGSDRRMGDSSPFGRMMRGMARTLEDEMDGSLTGYAAAGAAEQAEMAEAVRQAQQAQALGAVEALESECYAQFASAERKVSAALATADLAASPDLAKYLVALGHALVSLGAARTPPPTARLSNAAKSLQWALNRLCAFVSQRVLAFQAGGAQPATQLGAVGTYLIRFVTTTQMYVGQPDSLFHRQQHSLLGRLAGTAASSLVHDLSWLATHAPDSLPTGKKGKKKKKKKNK